MRGNEDRNRRWLATKVLSWNQTGAVGLQRCTHSKTGFHLCKHQLEWIPELSTCTRHFTSLSQMRLWTRLTRFSIHRNQKSRAVLWHQPVFSCGLYCSTMCKSRQGHGGGGCRIARLKRRETDFETGRKNFNEDISVLPRHHSEFLLRHFNTHTHTKKEPNSKGCARVPLRRLNLVDVWNITALATHCHNKAVVNGWRSLPPVKLAARPIWVCHLLQVFLTAETNTSPLF